MRTPQRTVGLLVGLLALSGAALAETPAGGGGFVWQTTTPQANDLRAAVAPASPSGGAGFLAAGDASTLLYRRVPLDAEPDLWTCQRQTIPQNDEHYLGVAATTRRDIVAVCTSLGRVFVGDGCVMLEADAKAPGALRAIGIGLLPQGGPTIATVGDGAALVSEDGGRSFQPAGLPDLPTPLTLVSIHFPEEDGRPGSVGFAAGEAGQRGVLLRSDDGGFQWREITTLPAMERLNDVFFLDAARGFVLGTLRGRAFLHYTESGGEAWRSVALPTAELRAVAAFDPMNVIVGGAEGLFYSESGGEKLVPVPEPITRLTDPIPITDLAVTPKSAEAWAVGERGVVFTSLDAGHSWRTAGRNPLDMAHLQTLFATRYLSYPGPPWPPPRPEGDILAVGTEGAVLRSRDGGRTYLPVVNPSTAALLALAAPGGRNAGMGGEDAKEAVMTGARRTILHFDAQEGVIRPRSGVPAADLRGVSLLRLGEVDHAWVVGASGLVMHRSSENPAWETLRVPTTADLNAVDVIALGATAVQGLAVGAGGTILRTTDGLGWASAGPLPKPYEATGLNDVALLDGKLGLIVGDGGLIARTTDGGVNWSIVFNPDTSLADLQGVTLLSTPNGVVAYAVGERQVVLRSLDGGGRWTLLPRPLPNAPDFTLRSVSFISGPEGVAVGDGGHILRTTSGGGQTPWEEIGSPGAISFRDVRFGPLKGSAVVGAGPDGPLFLVSPGFGEPYAPIGVPAGAGPLNDVDITETAMVAVGEGGTILGFDGPGGGGGPAASDEAGAIRATVSPVPGVYMAVGDAGLFIRSEDGGITWQNASVQNPFGADLRLNAVGFAAPTGTGQRGYAGGTARGGQLNVLFQTLDGGRTWVPIEIPFATDGGGINALAVISDTLVLAAAGNGVVYEGRGLSPEWAARRPDPNFTGAWHALRATAERWYVVGDGGRAARYPGTVDPRAWEMLATGTDNDLYSIAGPTNPPKAFGYDGGGDALHDDICNAVGEKGALLKTDTGGIALFADVNRDSSVTNVDAAAVLRALSGIEFAGIEVWYFGDIVPPGPTDAYVPGDGILDVLDAAAILRRAFGL